MNRQTYIWSSVFKSEVNMVSCWTLQFARKLESSDCLPPLTVVTPSFSFSKYRGLLTHAELWWSFYLSFLNPFSVLLLARSGRILHRAGQRRGSVSKKEKWY